VALALAYHAVEPGPAPLCLDPALFRAQLDCLEGFEAETVTVGQLAEGLRGGRLPQRTVAITFDDGFASVVREAVPLLLERGMTATVFCVAGHLGRLNDWPTQTPGAPLLPLAGRAELAELVRSGIEIGSHGIEHAPLDGAPDDVLHREVRASKEMLEDALGAPVGSFAYPYGAMPGPRGRRTVAETYRAACTTRMDVVTPHSDALAIPRVDSHYLARPEALARLVRGSVGPYLRARRLGARARRTIRKDYVSPR
jgi:peptidoglycan/xylan/chitin deacetylase (PgdA/CDA1 family)